MPRPAAPTLTRSVVARGLGFGLAIALGAVAVWLIVTGAMSPRRIEIGVLAGLWGLLLGAYTMFGARRHHGEPVHYVTSAELEVRSSGGLEPAAQAEARRAFEARLEHLLRTEISSSVNREVGDLRREVASLRQELVDKVGGQLRLERIETTRLIGSDLEALQHEVRQLKSARDAGASVPLPDAGAIPVAAERLDTPRRSDPAQADAAARALEDQVAAERQRAETARAQQAARDKAAQDAVAREKAERDRAARDQAERDRVEREKAARVRAEQERAAREKAAADKVAAERAAAAKVAAEKAAADKAAAEKASAERAAAQKAAAERAAAQQAAAEKAERERVERAKADAARAEHERLARAKAEQDRLAREQARSERATPTNGASSDPFASLPRITPFTDFELDPVETSGSGGPETNGHESGQGPSYTGRRRADSGAEIEDAGRHSRRPVEDAEGGRRRRTDEDDSDGLDLLSQLLSRGHADR